MGSTEDKDRETAGPKSLHQRILGEIENAIMAGNWPPGHKLPSEEHLAEQYGCSRMTVNKVLTQLARAGLIQRRRKIGSIVLQQKAQSAILQIYDIRDEVKALNKRYSHKIITGVSRPADVHEAKQLRVSVGHEIASILCLHFAGKTPFCLEERLINLTAVPDARSEDFIALPPGPWLIDHVPWSAAEHRISAESANDMAIRHLKIEAGTPVMVVERQTWRRDEPVTHVRLTYPGKQHVLTARFTPGQA